MSLRDYLDHFRQEIAKFEDYGYAESTEVKEEIRVLKQAVLTAKIVLLNGSELHIKEYIDARYKIEKVAYAYHYQDVQGNCIFRYDNAAHKPTLSFKEHKHQADGRTIAAQLPDISKIRDEVIRYL